MQGFKDICKKMQINLLMSKSFTTFAPEKCEYTEYYVIQHILNPINSFNKI